MIAKKQYDAYWKKIGAKVSDEFKDLMQKMLAVDGDERPTIEEIRNHPWMLKPFSMRLTRQELLTRWRKSQRKEKKLRKLIKK